MSDSLVIDVDQKAPIAALDALPPALDKRISRENRSTAQRVVLEARRRVHVRFGFLRDAIDWVQSDKTGDIYIGINRKASFVIPGTRRFNGKSDKARPSNYAHLLERGTDHSPAYPFLDPSVKSQESSHEGRVVEAMVDALGDVGLGD